MKPTVPAFYLCFLSLFTVALLLASGNFAKAHEPASSAMEVGFAFYKMAGVTPDIRNWIAASEDYQNSPPGERLDKLLNDFPVLKKQFDDFDPEQDVLVVVINSKIVVVPSDEEDGEHPYRLQLFAEGDNIEFFPYELAGQWLAVVVDNMKEHLSYDITQAELESIRRNIGAEMPLNSKKSMKIVFRLKPVSVDTESPLTIDGHDMWLILTKPAAVSLWRKGAFVWESQAEWYDSPTKIEVRKLFRE